jgi:hypothetical protein
MAQLVAKLPILQKRIRFSGLPGIVLENGLAIVCVDVDWILASEKSIAPIKRLSETC